MAATIETIAELGYGQASFARIAERAGLSSTRLISYHFAGKDDLINAVIAQVYTEMGEFMADFMAQCLGDPEAPAEEGTAGASGLFGPGSAGKAADAGGANPAGARAASSARPAQVDGAADAAESAVAGLAGVGGELGVGRSAGDAGDSGDARAGADGDARRADAGGAAGRADAGLAAGAACVEAAGGGRGVRARLLLRGYIGGVVAFIAEHPIQMRALMSVFLDYRAESGDRSYTASDEERTLGRLERILRDGQDSGEFRPFDTFVMAATIQRAVDGIPFLLQSRPDLDLVAYGGELITLFDRATVL